MYFLTVKNKLSSFAIFTISYPLFSLISKLASEVIAMIFFVSILLPSKIPDAEINFDPYKGQVKN